MNGSARTGRERVWVRWGLTLIVLAAGVLRIWGIGYDLPYVYHPDEPVYVEISQEIFKTRDLNPQFFNYPSLFFYIHALAYVPYYLIGRYLGPFNSPDDILSPVALTMGVVKSPMPTTVLMGRVITLTLGLGCVVLAFLGAKAVSGKKSVGLVAGTLMATAPVHVWNNRWITPDTLVTFFALASFLASGYVFREGKTWQYAVAGVCIGLTASSKYNGALILLALLVGHLLREGAGGFKSPRLYLGLLLSGFTFVATTPFAVLDYPTFIEDLRFEAEHYLTGHPGMEGDTLTWYVRHLWETTGPVGLLAVGEMVRGTLRRSRQTALTAAFPVTYFAFINRFTVRNARTVMPLTPFLFVLAASLLVHLLGRARDLNPSGLRHVSLVLVAGLLAVSVTLPLVRTIKTNQRLTRVDCREMARGWIVDRLPPGARIAVESYGPYVDPVSFSVEGVVRMIDQDLSWYVENGFDYLVFSEGMYGRYYRDQDEYEAEASRYDSLFDELEPVKEFRTDHGTIRVYQVVDQSRSGE